MIEDIDTKAIIEAANGPLYYGVDKLLKEKNIDVVPDILTNSGGVIVSYYEYLQNKSNDKRIREDVLNDLSKQMKETFVEVHKLKEEYNTTYRNASYGLAIQNIQKNLKYNDFRTKCIIIIY